jgi:predicted ATPase/DNA-binding CsgD family transcriptional regulator
VAVAFSLLQAQPTPLLGRTAELDTIEQWLIRDETRLLSLVGPAGVGKTRLALETASRLADRFPDGITFVNLAPVREPTLVLPAVARGLGLIDSGQRPLLARLHAYLHDRETLLILDNFEQVLSAGTALAELLASTPSLRILVTSRIPLRLRWERVYRISPFAVPDADVVLPLDALLQLPSIALFVERAQAQRADYMPTEEQGSILAQLARQLDGLPLAIELAAAQMSVLPLGVIAARFEHHVRTLRWDAHDLPDRHRSLHGAIDWSYALLTGAEQRVFRHLGVFLGRVALDAIEAVIGRGDEDDTLAGMLSLAEKSLVLPRPVNEDEPEPAFGMLETVREYAQEQLRAHDELDAAREAHALYFLELAERAEKKLYGKEQHPWRVQLEMEIDNLRSALDWLEEREDGARQLRLAAALGYFWWSHGHLAEGRGRLEHALARGQDPDRATRAKALNLLAITLISSAEEEQPRAVLDEALSLGQALHDQSSIALSLTTQGLLAERQGDWEKSDRLLTDASCLWQEVGDRFGLANALVHLGINALFEGDLERAEQTLGEGAAIYADLGDGRNWMLTSVWLAFVVGEQGDQHRGAHLLRSSADATLLVQEPALLFHYSTLVVGLVDVHGDLRLLARLHGALERLRSTHGFTYSPWTQDRFSRALAALQTHLTTHAFEAAAAEGRSLPPNEIVALALNVLDDLMDRDEPVTTVTTSPPRADGTLLSSREQEVLRLVADGFTSRQIAQQLFLSHRTVDSHVAAIFNKLGVESRAQAVAVAAQRGLL